MVDSILSLLGESVGQCGDWFLRIIDEIGALPLIIGAFMVFTSYRLLLRPLIGSASSDVVKGIRGKGNNQQKINSKAKK